MSGDSIDSAVNRSKNREVFVGAAVKYLGKERRRDAELLADIMVASTDLISAAAAVTILPNGEMSEPALQDLGEQMQRHGEEIAHVAIRAMANVFIKTLMAMRGDVPE